MPKKSHMAARVCWHCWVIQTPDSGRKSASGSCWGQHHQNSADAQPSPISQRSSEITGRSAWAFPNACSSPAWLSTRNTCGSWAQEVFSIQTRQITIHSIFHEAILCGGFGVGRGFFVLFFFLCVSEGQRERYWERSWLVLENFKGF